ncbi:unnamed protein product [Phytophthora lilii]|uniref:Unnamed protein product n=1 Tax=Phytophthora lilii TaxID=2077276 RepID=A0A9W6U5A1_9STRA|nr:unnamed protein product [Phytophthora lilii]
MGPYTLVDLRVHLDARTSISMAQQVMLYLIHILVWKWKPTLTVLLQIAKRVRSHILQEVPDVSEVLVHIDVQFAGSCIATATDVREKDIRPYKEIKNDISYALATIPEITGTTHINTHWLPHLGGQGTVVDVAIVVQPDLKVGAAHAVAKKARRYVSPHNSNLASHSTNHAYRRAIEAIPYIVEADIHLELQDDDSEQDAASPP